jgi:hypothetical protein
MSKIGSKLHLNNDLRRFAKRPVKQAAARAEAGVQNAATGTIHALR